VSACLGDVEIPDCVRTHTCSAGGGAGTSNAGSATGGHAGSEPTAGSATDGGDGDGGFVEVGGEAEAGGAAGASGTKPSGGTGGMPPICPGCVISPATLQTPCAGQPYEAKLQMNGGHAPFTWQLTPSVEGWSLAANPLDARQALLKTTSVARGNVTLTVRNTDAKGVETTMTYETLARDACWFAYTSSGSAGPQLTLLDPLNEEKPRAQLENNDAVYDFQFSPDGRHLAYRYNADEQHPHGRHLALVELTTLDEQRLTFAEDAVTAYAWSPDGRVLAVGFSANDHAYLGGVRMPQNSSDSPIALAPVQASVQDNLAWVGNDAVAYQVDVPPEHLISPFYSRVSTSGFEAEQDSLDKFEQAVVLRPAADGFWFIHAANTTFFPMTDYAGDAVLHHGIQLVAPSGRYSASLDGETLQLSRAHDSVDLKLFVVSPRPTDTCPMTLAWSGQDKVACLTDVSNSPQSGSHGEVRFFDVNSAGDELVMTTLPGFCTDDVSNVTSGSCTAKRQLYGYGMGEANHKPRAFSESGRWFAFARSVGDSGSYLYWADLQSAPASVTVSQPLNYGSPSRMVFSPDDHKLAVQLGGRIRIETLIGSGEPLMTPNELDVAEPCAEELPNAPNRYCGNTALDARFKWAPQSTALAYRMPGALKVVDASPTNELPFHPLPAPYCEQPLCSGSFEFQPSPYP
jgi:WD40 repeat protein